MNLWQFAINVPRINLLFLYLFEGSLISCPERNVIACIKCQCDSKGGYNRCTPAKKCPPPVSSFNEIRPFTAGE